MSTRTAIASLQPERAAQFRTLLDDCLASLTHWIHTARTASSTPEPRMFSQLALALDRLVTVAARIEPAGSAPTSTATPSSPAPSPQPRVPASLAVNEPPSASAAAPRPARPAPPVPSIKSIQSMVSMLSAMAAARTTHASASQSTPPTPSTPPASPPSPPLTPSPPRPSTITADLVRKRRRKKR